MAECGLGAGVKGLRDGFDHRRPMQVVEQRGHSVKAFGSEELLVVYARSVGFFKNGVALGWNASELVVKGHKESSI